MIIRYNDDWQKITRSISNEPLELIKYTFLDRFQSIVATDYFSMFRMDYYMYVLESAFLQESAYQSEEIVVIVVIRCFRISIYCNIKTNIALIQYTFTMYLTKR
jgi:hypothetical protein